MPPLAAFVINIVVALSAGAELGIVLEAAVDVSVTFEEVSPVPSVSPLLASLQASIPQQLSVVNAIMNVCFFIDLV